MEQNVRKDCAGTGERQNVSAAQAENRLRAAVVRVAPDEAAGERILEGVRAEKRSKKRLSVRIPAAALAACLLICLLCFGGARRLLFGEEVVVYAATAENGWQRLKEGERILLKKEPFELMCGDGDTDDFDAFGRCERYPYRCIFRVEVPEHYLYDQQRADIGDDTIMWFGENIEWWVAPDRPEDAGKVGKDSIRLWIVSDNVIKQRRERIGAYDLELTKEDGNCYAELKKVWEK